MATKIILLINKGLSGAAKSTKADTIVPIIAAKRHEMCRHKHLDNALGAVAAPKYTPISTKISANTPMPKEIHKAIVRKGICKNAYKTPTTAPRTMAITTPRQLQAVKPHLLKQLIYFFFSCVN